MSTPPAEFLCGYRDPYKGSTMMVLRGGRIDRL